MVKMYSINNLGMLSIIEIPMKIAIEICDNKKILFNDNKILTRQEFELCSEMDKESRQLYYKLKED